MSRPAWIAGLCGVLLVGCTSSDGNLSSTASETSPTVSPSLLIEASAEPSVSPYAGSNTTAVLLGGLVEPFEGGADGYQYVADFRWANGGWARKKGADGAEGSGCHPIGETLSDGVWFGYVRKWGAESLEFDLACVWDVSGWGETPEYEVTDDNSQTRSVPVASDAQYLFSSGMPFAYSFDKVVDARLVIDLPQTSDAVWLFINDGMVTQVEAWFQDVDVEYLAQGLPWVPWGPESEPVSDFRFSPEVRPDYESWMYFESLGAGPDGTIGSGCSPGGSESLPDGEWYGHVTDWRTDSIDFDLACVWSTEAASAKGLLDECDQTFCLEPFVTNDNEVIRVLQLDSRAQFLPQQSTLGAYPASTVVGVPVQFRPREWSDWVWVYVNDGSVTAFHKHYQP